MPKEKGAIPAEKPTEEKIMPPSEKKLPNEGETVLLIVEDALYDGLTPELNIYSNDIKKSLVLRQFSNHSPLWPAHLKLNPTLDKFITITS